MDKLIIKGRAKLKGEVRVSCAKNAYLPIITAALLNEFPVTFKNVPALRDINTIFKLLENLGVKIERKNNGDVVLDSSKLTSLEATYELVKTMRASILVLGPLLSRFKKAKVSLPGGCAIGARPIDIHLKNLEKMGTKISLERGYVEAETDGLVGTKLVLSFPSVGATENLMMAAVFAKGETFIENAALEPEITDLGNFLNAMGAKVSGHGTSIIKIEGVQKLKPVTYQAIGDRIEASTYLIAAVATQSEIKINGVDPLHLDAVIASLRDMGALIECGDNFIKVKGAKLKGTKITTAPYPGFPTDVQAQMIALATIVDGPSIITENIFENRFMHVPELQRMGAKIDLEGNCAFVMGESKLVGAPVMCTDLRASAALIIAALVAEGSTDIQRVYHLDRGYESLDEKLSALGAEVKRVKE